MNEGVVQGEAVHIRILDNGPGIPDGDLERPFDPFFTTRLQKTGWGFTSACRTTAYGCRLLNPMLLSVIAWLR